LPIDCLLDDVRHLESWQVRAARQRLRPLWNELCLSEEELCANEAAWSAAEGEEGASAEALETTLQEVEEEEAKLKAKLESMGKVRVRSECDLLLIAI
jgi:multidrug resistance efflux pump